MRAASGSGRLLAGAREHPLREVQPRHRPVRAHEPGQRDREVAGAAARVEHDGAAAHAGLGGGKRAPALIEAGGHRAVHQVIGPGDAVEHALDLGGRECPAAWERRQVRHGVECCTSPVIRVASCYETPSQAAVGVCSAPPVPASVSLPPFVQADTNVATHAIFFSSKPGCWPNAGIAPWPLVMMSTAAW